MSRHRYLVKLVRDRVPEVFKPAGMPTIEYGHVEHDEHVRLLRRKLIEEATEYALEPSEKELADVLEVVISLAFIDLDLDDARSFARLAEIARKKRAERGGYAGGVVMYEARPDAAAVEAAGGEPSR